MGTFSTGRGDRPVPSAMPFWCARGVQIGGILVRPRPQRSQIAAPGRARHLEQVGGPQRPDDKNEDAGRATPAWRKRTIMVDSIGIDVHKASVVVAQHGGPTWTVARTEAALTTLAMRLRTLAPAVVVLEPSGGYEASVIAILQHHQLPVARVPTQQMRAFIRGMGVHAKADRLDARMLARYGAMAAPRLTQAPTPTQQRVAKLSGWRRTLRADIVAKTHQLQDQPAEVAASIRRVIADLETECAQIAATIAAIVTSAPEWARPRAILASCPGVGPTTVALLLAELPELGHRSAKPLAALVGVAPFTQQSGRAAGPAHISGGRHHIRSGLWMPTLSAITHNPQLTAYAARLRAAHKPSKVVTIACMHKLLTILNAMLAKQEMWRPPPSPA